MTVESQGHKNTAHEIMTDFPAGVKTAHGILSIYL